MSTSVASPRPAERWRNYLDLIRWNRPAGWLLLLWPTLSALWIAAEGFPGWHLLAVFTLGTILMRSAGCCINDVADREFDRHVKRTVQRPITAGRISVREALLVGLVLTLAAFALVLTTNALTIAMSFLAVAVTVFYPFTKRFFAMPQAVLGVAFSFGIPMAFAAVQNHVPAEAWLLVIGNLLWVIAYDTEYAMVDRDDDLRLGLKTSAITLGRWDVMAITLFYLVFIALWVWVLASYDLGWPWLLAVLVALLQVGWHWRLIRHRRRESCFRAFTQNHWLGFTLFAGIVVGFVLRTPASG
ncbi:4-hydroxybenzoate polyprenyltransferase [Lampropedia cohaerens]|uniref:4-hydroxybenzoate octaprenyltransferase n=1 Tax=Lampropedia cohaerens TaxID=1610491 RepID=A0A0U1Q0Q2_9BURK|nr:4-hydroxybenzoate octaprenyltransferase [Lampropedia cohaerens]KKW68330.1 4-hydroxybenzoate polyprenyltransferase [Lampropedia cohaerens]